jgi:GxxExxY protein
MADMPIDDLTEIIINAAMAVHSELGPGLLESIYRDCLRIELMTRELSIHTEKQVPVIYRGHRIRDDLRIDLLVDTRVIVEIKAVDRMNPVYQAQVITYLKLTGCPAGLLFNFNATSIRAGMKRLDHPDIYATKVKERLHRRAAK